MLFFSWKWIMMEDERRDDAIKDDQFLTASLKQILIKWKINEEEGSSGVI